MYGKGVCLRVLLVVHGSDWPPAFAILVPRRRIMALAIHHPRPEMQFPLQFIFPQPLRPKLFHIAPPEFPPALTNPRIVPETRHHWSVETQSPVATPASPARPRGKSSARQISSPAAPAMHLPSSPACIRSRPPPGSPPSPRPCRADPPKHQPKTI